jgi:glycerophosphoryl diester phosphodiesterase
VEIDIHSMAGDDYLVSHASRLEESTTSTGPVGRLRPENARSLRRRDDPGQGVPLLSDVVALAEGYDSELQLDLKDWRPLTAERAAALFGILRPLGLRAIVSSGQDWNLAALRARDSRLRLGFDPDHYLAGGSRDVPLPAHVGAYGYRDDHPLAIGRAQPVSEYLSHRMAALAMSCPFAEEFFIEKSLILQASDDGASVVAPLHERGIKVSAWTLDYAGDESLRALGRLLDAGVDRITTNTSVQFRRALGV